MPISAMCVSSYIAQRSCHKSPWSCKVFAPRLGATCNKNDVEERGQNQHALTITVITVYFDWKCVKRDSSFSWSYSNRAPLGNDSLQMSFCSFLGYTVYIYLSNYQYIRYTLSYILNLSIAYELAIRPRDTSQLGSTSSEKDPTHR